MKNNLGIKDCLLVLGGIDLAGWKGDWVWWVSLVAWVLSDWKSIVLQGLPFFFAHITI